MRVVLGSRHRHLAIVMPKCVRLPLRSIQNSRRYSLSISYRKVVRDRACRVIWRASYRRFSRKGVQCLRAAARADSIAEPPTLISSSNDGWRQKGRTAADSTLPDGLHHTSSMLSQTYGVDFEIEYPPGADPRYVSAFGQRKCLA